ncbi:MAG: hypothetical protein OER12_03605 [Acidimicrobiia bacterium]|nr:hypothetical protein [Acidimicrobiia bacterium]
MLDLLLPETDADVAVQLAIFVVLAVGAAFLARRRPEWLLLVGGLTVFGLSLFGVRALH